MRAEAEEREHVTKAAIFLLQGKNADANAEIERMGGTLTQPSVEATNVFRSLATWSAMNGDWKTAAKRLVALSRVNRFDENDQTDNVTRDLVAVAPTLITAGDIAAYHDFDHFLIAQLGHTNNPVAAEHVLKSCLLLPPDPVLLAALNPAATVAAKSLTGDALVPADHLEAWRCAVLGLWNYRNAQYDEAIKYCDRALRFQNEEKTRDAYALVIRAMACARLGRTAEATANFETARAMIEKKFIKPLEFDSEGYWNDWLAARILLQEARSTVAQK